MKQRFKLGIIFRFNPTWMGGIIYILNLIKMLDYLDDDDKPEIILFYKKDLKKFLNEINYPYFKAIEWSYPSVYKGYLISILSRRNIFIEDILANHELDAIYPLHDYPIKKITKTKLVCWFADLQHKYYPEFFSFRKRIERNLRHRFMFKNCNNLVVSSNSVAEDFRKFYNIRKEVKIHIFHFVSVIENLNYQNIDKIKEKYCLPDEYFIVSNQFHKHKNHRILLMAMIRLKSLGFKMHLAMTGRFPDSSSSPYMQELHKLISDNGLQSQICFLGVIPRNEQLIIMKFAQAVIQPSLFEGWSTVIEDAISLQVPVIASSLPVNIEQLGLNGNFFEPNDDNKLADIIYNFPKRNVNNVIYQDYEVRVKSAAKDFINIFKIN